jgi:hypothetical protein
MAWLDWFRTAGRAAVILALAVVLAACATMGPPLVMTASFDPEAASFIHAKGRAKVSGQAFVRLNNGKLLRAVGTDITLIPRTPYADERMAAIYGDDKQAGRAVNIPDADPRYVQSTRTTVASSGGSFSFDDVADGEYYVVAMIHIPSDYLRVERPIYERVTVKGGESVRIVMRGY